MKNWKRGSWPWPYKDTLAHTQKLWCCSRCTHTSKNEEREKKIFTIALCFGSFFCCRFLFCSPLIFLFHFFRLDFAITPFHMKHASVLPLYASKWSDSNSRGKKNHERISRKGNKQTSEQTKKSTEKKKQINIKAATKTKAYVYVHRSRCRFISLALFLRINYSLNYSHIYTSLFRTLTYTFTHTRTKCATNSKNPYYN